MERTCIAITSSDKDAVMHLEIYTPEDKSNLKGMIQICHGMTEYVWRYKSFAEYFTSRGYVVFGNDIISHGRSNTQKSLGLYFTDCEMFTMMRKKQESMFRKNILAFRCIFLVFHLALML